MAYRRVVLNRKLVAEHAAPQAIAVFMLEVLEAQEQAEEEYVWLSNLYQTKTGQTPPVTIR